MVISQMFSITYLVTKNFHIDIDNLCDLKIKLKYLPDGYEKEISGQHSTQPI